MKPRIRASSLPQLLNCHGSRTLIPLVKKREGGEGWEGTMGHWTVADRLIKESGAKTPTDFLSKPDVPEGYTLPKMSEWVAPWILRQVAEDFPPTYALEVEGYFEAEFDRFILTGRMDINGVNAEGTDFIGADEKWGYKPVIAADLNDQILGYLGLAKKNYPKLTSAKFKLYQPRNSEEDGFQRVSSVSLDGEQLNDCVTFLNDRINAALDDPMTVNSGMLQCSWCPAAAARLIDGEGSLVCPAIRQEFENMKAILTPQFLATIKTDAPDATLVDLLIASRTVNRAVEDVEAILHERLAANGSATATDGTRVTQKITGGAYKVTNPEGAWEAVNSLVPPARMPFVVKYSTTEIVDEIADAQKIPKGGKAAVTGKTVFDSVVRPHMEQSQRKLFVFAP